jgi:hypothetical protein
MLIAAGIALFFPLLCAEFFNLFTRVQFGYPGMTMGNANFGVVGSQWNNPRQVQMALRLTFSFALTS